jgi:hypothetical protein
MYGLAKVALRHTRRKTLGMILAINTWQHLFNYSLTDLDCPSRQSPYLLTLPISIKQTETKIIAFLCELLPVRLQLRLDPPEMYLT